MLNAKLVFLIIILCLVLPGFSQTFDGTAFSSSKPFYGEPPYRLEGSEYYFITFKTDPQVIRNLVPEPLVPISNEEIQVFFAKQKVVDPAKLNYHEVFFLIPVSYGQVAGGFMPVLYLDKVEGILPGREIWGYNKVGAKIEFKGDNQKMRIKVTQLDTLLMEASFTLGDPFVPEEKPPNGGIINYKYIPSVEANAEPDVKQLTYSNSENSKTTKMRLGKAELKFFKSFYNPVHKIPILEIKNAGYSENSFTLVYGKVIHDYLKKK